jgi:hypothetical protein
MPKFNIEKNNVCNEKLYCDEKLYCYKHQKCNIQLKNKRQDPDLVRACTQQDPYLVRACPDLCSGLYKTERQDRDKVVMYVLGLISIYNMKNSKCSKSSARSCRSVLYRPEQRSGQVRIESESNSKCIKRNKLQNFFKINEDPISVQMQKNTFEDSCTGSTDTECLKCKLKNNNIVHLLNIYINSIKQLIIFFYNQ